MKRKVSRLRGAFHAPLRSMTRSIFNFQITQLPNYKIYFPTHWSTQAFTVLYQSWEFCGLSTQWPSSGK